MLPQLIKVDEEVWPAQASLHALFNHMLVMNHVSIMLLSTHSLHVQGIQ